jgi:hypothetical protein
MQTTADDTVWWNNGEGRAFKIEDPNPGQRFIKSLPCGHWGLWVFDRWVCQVCWSWEK